VYEAFNAAAASSADSTVLFHAPGVVVSAAARQQLASALREGIGIVTPTIADSSDRVLSAGLNLVKTRMSPLYFEVVARRAGERFDASAQAENVAVAPGACLLMSRELFDELGGFSRRYADALADVDLSLRVRERGLRIVCVRSALAVAHSSDAADPNDPRRVPAARARLDADWRGRVADWLEPARPSLRETRVAPERYMDLPAAARPITAFVYGEVSDLPALETTLLRSGASIARIVWNIALDPPQLFIPVDVDRSDTTAAARAAMELRGERAIAFVDSARPPGEGWLASLSAQLSWGADVVAAAENGHTLVALSDIPQHVRLDERLDLHSALDDLLARLQPCGLAVRGTQPHAKREAPVARADGLASIIMLSWNAPNYTKLALESIRAHTHHPYEIIIVDNGSGPETTNWLRTLDDAVVIFNATNRGFAGGNNQGIAAARGEYIVILNNDVVVTEGWLEDLIDALRRNPLTGVSAPRSNRVAGSQMIADADYPDVAAMHTFAAERRKRWRKTGFYVERAIGFCLCVDRRVIDEIGGIDERFGAGNFEDDDFSIRVRAAGYKIYVCDDVFIHHFGSVTFTANKVDWQASMQENWVKFARKWGLAEQYPANGYLPGPVIARGFDRAAHFVALPGTDGELAGESTAAAASPRRAADLRFAALVRNEDDWSIVGAFVRRFARAFDAAAAATLEIAACGTIDAATLGERVVRLLERNGMEAEQVAEIGIDDVGDVDAWLVDLGPASLVRFQGGAFGGAFDALVVIEGTNPSSLRRTLARFST
jgi:GT2 family glycosyltransferase